MPSHNNGATEKPGTAIAERLHRRVALVMQHDSERGAGLLEYALLLVLVLIVAFLSIMLFGETIVGLFEFAAGTFDPTRGTP